MRKRTVNVIPAIKDYNYWYGAARILLNIENKKLYTVQYVDHKDYYDHIYNDILITSKGFLDRDHTVRVSELKAVCEYALNTDFSGCSLNEIRYRVMIFLEKLNKTA